MHAHWLISAHDLGAYLGKAKRDKGKWKVQFFSKRRMPTVQVQTQFSMIHGGDWTIVDDAVTEFSDDMEVSQESEDGQTMRIRRMADEPVPEKREMDEHEDSDDWTDVVTEVIRLSSWPIFPDKYFLDLGNAHQRWGGKSKSWKYEVPRCDPIFHPRSGVFMTQERYVLEHVSPRFYHWLKARHLERHLKVRIRCGELPLQGGTKFINYRYMPHKDIQASPAMRSKPRTVYHSTYAPCLARILHQGRLLESVEGLKGMESHVKFPATYTAETMDHAFKYSWPCNLFDDNLYYSFMLELEVRQPEDVLMLHRGEVLVKSEGLIIRSVYIFCNRHIAKGQPRCQFVCREFELLPEYFPREEVPEHYKIKFPHSVWHS